MKLFIAIPSRERADRLEDTIKSLYNTANGLNFHITVRIDEDDPQSDKYYALAKKYPISLTVGKPGKYCQLINEIANTNFNGLYDAFLCGTDDFICADAGWDLALASLDKDKKMWLAWFDDEEKKTECAQLPILSHDFVKYLGTPLHPDLGHFKGDKFVTDVAQKLGISHYIGTHRMIHMTPKTGKGPVDSTFLRVRMGDQVIKDENTYARLINEIDEYIEKLNKVQSN